MIAEQLTERVICLAIEVHRHTGLGLLEPVYEQCLCHELSEAGLILNFHVRRLADGIRRYVL
jgi:hypothetical protein